MARERQSDTKQTTINADGIWADLDEVRQFATELPEEYLQCRDSGHRWLPHDAAKHPDGSYSRVMRCPRCRTRKEQDIDSRGAIVGTQYKHPEGYLHQGQGRIAGDGKGILRLESIHRALIKKEQRPATKANRSTT